MKKALKIAIASFGCVAAVGIGRYIGKTIDKKFLKKRGV